MLSPIAVFIFKEYTLEYEHWGLPFILIFPGYYMLDYSRFQILITLLHHAPLSQRKLSQQVGLSLGKTNQLIRSLTEANYLQDGLLTPAGLEALQPYKVDNAIIMAAGMSSRFAPLSYEKPKGLLVVKDEVLIERQIRQLQEAGITDITVVVGYMKERFFYLEEKFGVKIVINEDYWRYNNTSTLIRVLPELKNTYICSSDNYFTCNVFEPYVYQAYYSAVYFPGKCQEWGLRCDKKGRITGIDHQPEDMWCMLGHVYFSRTFSHQFRTLLQQEYPHGDTRFQLWETLYERNLHQLDLYIRKYDAGQVLEFDSLEELRSFDSRYLENTGSQIFRNICSVLHCAESDIENIQVLKKGLTNLSFVFSCQGVQYIYRHPGPGTEQYISRPGEAFSQNAAKTLGLDDTAVHLDAETGWKLSRYIPNVRELDYHAESDVRQAVAMLKRLHGAKLCSPCSTDIWQQTLSLIDKISRKRKDFADFDALLADMTQLQKYVEADQVPKTLCHRNSDASSFLQDPTGRMLLIDWEYAGNDDPAIDLGTFICCSDYTFEEALRVLEMYYERALTPTELRHALACISIAAYYWFVWALYQESLDNIVGQPLYVWYQTARTYLRRAMDLYTAE